MRFYIWKSNFLRTFVLRFKKVITQISLFNFKKRLITLLHKIPMTRNFHEYYNL